MSKFFGVLCIIILSYNFVKIVAQFVTDLTFVSKYEQYRLSEGGSDFEGTLTSSKATTNNEINAGATTWPGKREEHAECFHICAKFLILSGAGLLKAVNLSG